MAACPSHAIQLVNFEEEQILRQIEIGFEHAEGPKILALLCYWCSYASADLLGRYGLKLPESVRTIRIRCSSSINSDLIAKMLGLVDGVLIAGCSPKNCHHQWGNYIAAKRVGLIRQVLRQLNSKKIVRWEYIGVPMWADLAKAIEGMYKELAKG